MLAIDRREQYLLYRTGLTGSIINSTFTKYRSAETAAGERMRSQREARLLQPHAKARQSEEIPFIGSARFPQRWTDE